ncbi:MAG: sigma-70 family RNA polymerase sigma factor [Muribaculaceae bacterium]|nr:sigma-70 family RNA polymerase sigma factor [Muribaculaceae bacterium]
MTGDKLTEIFIGMRNRLRRTALYITGNHDDADDALQDAFCRLWERRHFIAVGDEDGCPEGYMSRTVARSAIDLLRRANDCASLDDAGDRAADDDVASEGPTDVLQRLVRIIDDSLPVMQREVMHMHDVEGLDVDEIAEFMSLTPVAVRVNLSRARSRVRELYHKKYNTCM